ncbi:MAG: hypothetical protein WBB07_06455 [Mycobacterium sp.]
MTVDLDGLVHLVLAAGSTTVLIDGRSGAGKSTLADHLQQCWDSSTVVRLDDIYPGWDGLAWAAAHVHTALLQPRAAGHPGRWQQWDWVTGTPAGWRTVAPGARLILEGVGALAAGNRPLADIGIWVDAPDDVRKHQAMQRDGDTFRPHWERWAAQEELLMASDGPREAADYLATDTGPGRAWAFVPNHPA